jgi:hypothetical protein
LGANPNSRDACSCTPLWIAAKYGTAGTLRALIDAGGDVNVADARGWTPVLAVVNLKVLLSGRREERLRVLLDQPSLDFHATVAGLNLTEWVLRRGREDFIAMVAGEVGAVWQSLSGVCTTTLL